MSLVVVRLRGTVNVNRKIADTLDMLNLQRPQHATVVPADAAHQGMVKKAKDYITYGEVDSGTVTQLLTERGQVEGDQPLTDDLVSERTDHGSIQELAEAIARDDARLGDVPGLKPVFRLQPPQGGFRPTKRHHGVGGALGYRGEAINDLVRNMI